MVCIMYLLDMTTPHDIATQRAISSTLVRVWVRGSRCVMLAWMTVSGTSLDRSPLSSDGAASRSGGYSISFSDSNSISSLDFSI